MHRTRIVIIILAGTLILKQKAAQNLLLVPTPLPELQSPPTPVRSPVEPTDFLKSILSKYSIIPEDLKRSYRAPVPPGLPVLCIFECWIPRGPFKGGRIVANCYKNNILRCYIVNKQRTDAVDISPSCFHVMKNHIQYREQQEKQAAQQQPVQYSSTMKMPSK